MMARRRTWLWAVVLSLGVMWGLGPLGCQPGGSPPKSDKESKITLSPQAMEHFRQAHKFLAEKKLDEAFKEFQETVRLAPDSPLAEYWLGRAYFFKRDMDQAHKTFQKVLQKDPKNYHAMAMLGKIASLDKARLDEAQKYLQQALDESPENLEAHFDLGRVYALKGDRERSIREFAFIFNKEGEFAPYHFEMGRILEAWGQKDAAMSHYKRALVLSPNFDLAKQAIQTLEKGGTPGAAPKPNPTPSAPPASQPRR